MDFTCMLMIACSGMALILALAKGRGPLWAPEGQYLGHTTKKVKGCCLYSSDTEVPDDFAVFNPLAFIMDLNIP